MSQATTITLAQVREALRVTHTDDDALLQRLLDAATAECLMYLGRTQLPTLPAEYPVDSDGYITSEEVPSSEDPVAPDVANGILLLVQQDYDGDPSSRGDARKAAEMLWAEHRIGLGV